VVFFVHNWPYILKPIKNMIQKIGIYARQSREKETSGSIEDQILHGITKAAELSMPYEIYTDRDISGDDDTLERRPQFMKLLQDIKDGTITAVSAIDETRLTRNPITKLIIKKTFSDHKIKIFTKIEGIIDYDDPDCELLSDIKTLFAHRFVRDTSLKIKSVLRKNALEGKAHGGLLKPYGYKSDDKKMLVVDDDEAVIIKDIYSLCIGGHGSGKIAQILNERGVPTKGKKLMPNGITFRDKITKERINYIPNEKITWAPNTVLSILKNPLYMGERRHRGETFPAPKIVDMRTWNSVQERIKKNTNAPGLSKHNYLLKGLCVCGRCGSNFCGRTRLSKRDHVYRCASKIKKGEGCGIRSINIDTLDNVIWLMIIQSDVITKRAKQEVESLKNPQYIQELRENKVVIENKIQIENTTKLNVIKLLKGGRLTYEEAEQEMDKCIENIKNLKEKLSQIDLKLDLDTSLAQKIDDVTEYFNKWCDMAKTPDFNLKYALVRAFIEKVIIDFDDNDEIYTLQIVAKLPDMNELHTSFVNKQGMLQCIDNGERVYYNGIESPKYVHEIVSVQNSDSICKNDIKLDLDNYVVGVHGVKHYKLSPLKQHSDLAYGMVRRPERPHGYQRIGCC